MYRIYCDETWSPTHTDVKQPYYVFYGVMVEDRFEDEILSTINEFRLRRGLIKEDGTLLGELKWEKVENEWNQSQKNARRSRYEEFLEIFFRILAVRKISFGYLFLRSDEYKRVEKDFQKKQPDSKHNFFFMLYFQFLYHCFIRPQVKQKPCSIFIDNRDTGRQGSRYDINTLKEVLNRRLYSDLSPRNQLHLTPKLRKQFDESIQFVNLAESKQKPLIQLADLCAGCIRYILEHKIPAPSPLGQLGLFDNQETGNHLSKGRIELANYFYRSLRAMTGYNEINLLKVSRHHRFSIFPFEFDK